MRKYKLIIIITYLLLTVSGFTADYFYNNVPKVSLTKAQVGVTADTASYSGTIQAPMYHVFLNSQAMMKEIYVQEGQYVAEGQLIARVDINKKESISTPYHESVSLLLPSNIDKNAILEIINSQALQEHNVSISQSGAGIYAPHSGYIKEINIQSGEYTAIGKPIFSIMDYQDMRLKIWVGEDRIGAIKLGQSVIISGNGFHNKYSGYVDQIEDKASQTLLNNNGAQVAVSIGITDADNEILPGFTATATIRLGIRKNVVKIPMSLIDQDPSGQEYVWIYDNGIVNKKYVNCKYSSSGYAEMINFDEECYIASSTGQELNEGDRVLLDKDWKTW